MGFGETFFFQNPFAYTGFQKKIVEEPVEKEVNIPPFPISFGKQKKIFQGRGKCNCGMLSCICY